MRWMAGCMAGDAAEFNGLCGLVLDGLFITEVVL